MPPDHFKQVDMHYINPCHDVLPPSSQFELGHMTFDDFVEEQKFENFDELTLCDGFPY